MNEKRPAMYEAIQEKIIIPESEREVEIPDRQPDHLTDYFTFVTSRC